MAVKANKARRRWRTLQKRLRLTPRKAVKSPPRNARRRAVRRGGSGRNSETGRRGCRHRKIEEIARKKLSGKKLTSTEALRLEEYKKLSSEAETAQAQSTAARAQSLAEKQAAEMATRLINRMNNGTMIDTMLDLSGIRTVMPEIERLNAKRR